MRGRPSGHDEWMGVLMVVTLVTLAVGTAILLIVDQVLMRRK
jgi:hypothetical protein